MLAKAQLCVAYRVFLAEYGPVLKRIECKKRRIAERPGWRIVSIDCRLVVELNSASDRQAVMTSNNLIAPKKD
jgi:hypothetical protein